MSASGSEGRPNAVSARLRLLEAADADLAGPQALRSALQHAVAELGGLGGGVHLSGLDHPWAQLLLVSSTELPPGITRVWQGLPRDGSTAPGDAFCNQRYAWVPSLRSGLEPGGAASSSPSSGLVVDVGVAAVVLPGVADRPLGALSVLTLPQAPPGAVQRAFLGDVARWVGGRLRSLTPPARHPGEAVVTGDWECDLAVGGMRIDGRVLDAAGVTDHDGRVDGWLGRIHPDDLLWAMTAIHRGLRARDLADCAYRVRRTADGGYSWVRMRGNGSDAHGGGAVREGGTLTVLMHEGAESASGVLRDAAGAADRALLVANLTRGLTRALTVDNVVDAVAENLLPPLGASGFTVLTLEDSEQGPALHLLGAHGYPQPAFRKRVSGLPLASHSAASQTLREGVPQFVRSREEHTRRYPDVADIPDIGEKQAWFFLPLAVAEEPGVKLVGVAVVSFDEPHEASQDEKTLMMAISGLIAQAVERARLFYLKAREAEEATARARRLQEGLLPRMLPDLRAVTAAARHWPARGVGVGGDWYDVIGLSSDRVALVAGDVMGHGMSQAGTMGRLRGAVRTLSALDMPAEEVLAHLNDIVAEIDAELGDDDESVGAYFATCLYGIYDPAARSYRYASAGHLPPAHVYPDGTVAFPGSLPDPPLGVGEAPFGAHTINVPDGSLLALFTDGLVESRQRSIDDGVDRLAGILRSEHASSLDSVCEAVTSALLPAGQPAGDDAALLVARTHALPPDDIATWSLPEHPTAAGEARRHVRSQLTIWGLDEALITGAELIVSELIGNVIRHAVGPIKLRLMHSRHLVVEVSDGSLTTPHIRHPSSNDEGGRGLRLVTAMAHRWGTRHGRHGKTIWTEQVTTAPSEPDGQFLVNINLDDIPEI